MLAGVAVAGTAVLVWVARVRAALVRAALIRVATLVEDGVRMLQIALLRLFRRSASPLLIPFVGHGSPQRVELGARAVLGRPEARARMLRVPDRRRARARPRPGTGARPAIPTLHAALQPGAVPERRGGRRGRHRPHPRCHRHRAQ